MYSTIGKISLHGACRKFIYIYIHIYVCYIAGIKLNCQTSFAFCWQVKLLSTAWNLPPGLYPCSLPIGGKGRMVEIFPWCQQLGKFPQRCNIDPFPRRRTSGWNGKNTVSKFPKGTFFRFYPLKLTVAPENGWLESNFSFGARPISRCPTWEDKKEA